MFGKKWRVWHGVCVDSKICQHYTGTKPIWLILPHNGLSSSSTMTWCVKECKVSQLSSNLSSLLASKPPHHNFLPVFLWSLLLHLFIISLGDNLIITFISPYTFTFNYLWNHSPYQQLCYYSPTRRLTMSFGEKFFADNEGFEKSIRQLRVKYEEIQARTYRNWINSVLIQVSPLPLVWRVGFFLNPRL